MIVSEDVRDLVAGSELAGFEFGSGSDGGDSGFAGQLLDGRGVEVGGEACTDDADLDGGRTDGA